MNVYNLSESDIQHVANNAKELVLRTMESEGLIPKDSAKQLAQQYLIICYSKGWLGDFLDKLWKIPNKTSFVMVKIVPPIKDDDQPPPS